MRRIAAVLSCVLAPACTTAGAIGSHTKSGFPTAATLSKVAAAPAPKLADAAQYHDPEQWVVPGPFPADVALRAYPGAQPWDQMLNQSLTPSAGMSVASVGMHCVAQAFAQFYLQHQALPSPSVQSFVMGRCRATPAAIQVKFLSGEVPASVDDAQLFQQWQSSLQKTLGKADASRLEAVGLGWARDDNRAVLLVARGERRAFLKPVRIEQGHVIVAGRLLLPHPKLRVNITQGAHGYAVCTENPKLRMPDFELRCPLAPGDTSAWVQVASFAAGRVLGDTAAMLLVGTSEAPPTTFFRPKVPGADLDVSPATLTQTFLNSVNTVRSQAGLQPLALAAAQTAEATSLAPHFFNAQLVTRDAGTADTVSLGLCAGWKVPEMVRYSHFSTSVSVGTQSLRFVLGDLLRLPLSRQTLLDPDVRQVALGPVTDPAGPFIGVMVSTYALYGDADPKTLADELFSSLNQRRAEAGSAPVRRLSQLGVGEDRATRQVADGRDPERALNSLLAGATSVLHTSVRGFVFELPDLESIEWPPALVQTKTLDLHLSVTWYQPAHEPWGRYVIFVVYPDGGSGAI